MKLFLSKFNNKLDKKGRVSVPAQFRSVINGEEFSGIIAYKSFINECIEACGISRISRIYESIDDLDPFSNERDAFATAILGGSCQLAFDGDGRICLPDEYINHLNVSENIIFVGKGSTFEMWNPNKFEEYFDRSVQEAKNNRDRLSIKKL